MSGAETTLERIKGLLIQQGLTLAVAESATGGRIADRITNISGSSRYFVGGVIAYDNRVKVDALGIKEGSLARWGAVSEAVAKEMADGVRRFLNADIGLAGTGVAGPTGATATKPVGLVYIGVASRRGARAERHQFSGSREENKEAFTRAALGMLLRELELCANGTS